MRVIISLFFLIVFQLSQAQFNLIPNPSFEEKNGCPDFITMYSYEFGIIVTDWRADDANPLNTPVAGNTPDYFNSCAIGDFVGVPQNFSGYQQAKDGDGYVGLSYGYQDSSLTGEDRHTSEYIFSQLQEPLVANQVYTFTMYASLADSLEYAANQLGALFIDTLPFEGGYITSDFISNHTPQILGTELINDKNNWTKIEGTFTAQGNEQYIIIGHFPDPETLEVQHNGIEMDYTDYFVTYYYIDNVSLMEGDLFSDNFNNKEIKIHPNPATDNIYIDGIEQNEIKSMSILDMNGREVSTQSNTTLNINNLSSGIYLLKIETRENFIFTQKFIRQ